MERKTKIILWVTGGVIVLSAIGFGVYKVIQKRDERKQQDKENEANTNTSGNNSGTGTGTGTTTEPPKVDPNLVTPKYNGENELINEYSELVGRTLYPKRKEFEGWDFANIRTTPEVNTNKSGWWDFKDNLLTTISSGTPIGKVNGVESKDFNGHAYRWFSVVLQKPVWTFWTGTLHFGYVRADAVTIKPYEK